ncbi:MAG: hypothetical protein PHV59_08680 [Victivallales bacterium]|nr:hypothetical protein [Victivallales bacterium]
MEKLNRINAIREKVAGNNALDNYLRDLTVRAFNQECGDIELLGNDKTVVSILEVMNSAQLIKLFPLLDAVHVAGMIEMQEVHRIVIEAGKLKSAIRKEPFYKDVQRRREAGEMLKSALIDVWEDGGARASGLFSPNAKGKNEAEKDTKRREAFRKGFLRWQAPKRKKKLKMTKKGHF